MKIFFVLLSFLIVLACSKDNDNKQFNSFTFQGTNYELDDGLIWITNEWFKIELYSPGVNMTAGIQETEPRYIGDGEILFFGYMIPSSSGEISNGEYTFSSEGTESFTFSEGLIAIGLDLIDYNGDIYQVTEGTVNVQNNDGDVVIDFNLTLTGGEKMSGNYTGPIYIWDDSINDWR